MTYHELRTGVFSQLGRQEHRFAHVIRVARLAERLAAAHGVSTKKARSAGMLHDLARLYPPPVLIAECEERGLSIDAFERAAPIVLHARLGAELARERFGVFDAEVLCAIRKHTVAAEEMSALDAVLYLADALEAGRDIPHRATMLATAMKDLDAGMRDVLASSIAYLRCRDQPVAPQTIAALRAYEQRAIHKEIAPA